METTPSIVTGKRSNASTLKNTKFNPGSIFPYMDFPQRPILDPIRHL